jgi:hypothetical protein
MRCWYTRWQMSNALDRGELGPRTARGHAARCAACQAFGHALAALDTRLAREAHTAAAPDLLAPAALRAPAAPAGPAVRRSRWLAAGPAVAAAVAVIAIAIVRGGAPETPGTPDEPVASPPSAGPGEVVVRARGLADQVSQAFARTPLDAELDNLLDDGKRGLAAVLAPTGLRRP